MEKDENKKEHKNLVIDDRSVGMIHFEKRFEKRLLTISIKDEKTNKWIKWA